LNRYRIHAIILLLLLSAIPSRAQQILERIISIDARQQPLSRVLQTISSQGKFRFSYNTSIVPEDSLVSISLQQKTVGQALDQLFGTRYEYRETGDYLILHLAAPSGQVWYVSGYVFDERTGERIRDASVYEIQQLASTMTNEQGFFRLRLKDRYPTATISIRKAWYTDTFMVLKPGIDQELTVSISPKNVVLDTLVVTPVEKTWLGGLLLSSRQRMQSLNLGKYFLDKPYQTSLTPGLGTHGRMSGQVVNKVSFNVFGGYSAGIQGFELGGLFNIVKEDMQFLQIAGIFNMVGGGMTGVQIAGIHNHALDTVVGVQLGGLDNIATGSLKGVQASGLINMVSGATDGAQLAGLINIGIKETEGVQLAGLGNFNSQNLRGVQAAGLANLAVDTVEGVQIAGFTNFARVLHGVQVGVINVADTSTGYSFGLINIVRKGYHKISLHASEVVPVNFAFKTGTRKLYSILAGGLTPDPARKVYMFGYGLGLEIPMGKRWALNPEVTAQQVFLGDWFHFNLLNRTDVSVQWKLAKNISLFAGPSFSVYYSQQRNPEEGYRQVVPYDNTIPLSLKNTQAWFGGNAGLVFF
jgi:hypothetical protein